MRQRPIIPYEPRRWRPFRVRRSYALGVALCAVGIVLALTILVATFGTTRAAEGLRGRVNVILLASVATFAVAHLLSRWDEPGEREPAVVAAARWISQGMFRLLAVLGILAAFDAPLVGAAALGVMLAHDTLVLLEAVARPGWPPSPR